MWKKYYNDAEVGGALSASMQAAARIERATAAAREEDAGAASAAAADAECADLLVQTDREVADKKRRLDDDNARKGRVDDALKALIKVKAEEGAVANVLAAARAVGRADNALRSAEYLAEIELRPEEPEASATHAGAAATQPQAVRKAQSDLAAKMSDFDDILKREESRLPPAAVEAIAANASDCKMCAVALIKAAEKTTAARCTADDAYTKAIEGAPESPSFAVRLAETAYKAALSKQKTLKLQKVELARVAALARERANAAHTNLVKARQDAAAQASKSVASVNATRVANQADIAERVQKRKDDIDKEGKDLLAHVDATTVLECEACESMCAVAAPH